MACRCGTGWAGVKNGEASALPLVATRDTLELANERLEPAAQSQERDDRDRETTASGGNIGPFG
jgi:hypothetical protein